MASLTLPLTLGGLEGDCSLFGRFSQNDARVMFDASGIKFGQRVLHPKFREVSSRQFDDVGAKWLVTAYALRDPLIFRDSNNSKCAGI